MEQPTRRTFDERMRRIDRWISSVLIVVLVAALTYFVAEVVRRGAPPNTPPPSDLPPALRAHFDAIRRDLIFHRSPLTYNRGQLNVVHSPLLKRHFPEYCFVRGSIHILSHWWEPSGWGPAARGMRLFVAAIPRNGGEPIVFRRFGDVLDFLCSNNLMVRTHAEAERIRRLRLELIPMLRQSSRQHEQVSATQWRIGVVRHEERASYVAITTDAEGRVQEWEFRQSTD